MWPRLINSQSVHYTPNTVSLLQFGFLQIPSGLFRNNSNDSKLVLVYGSNGRLSSAGLTSVLVCVNVYVHMCVEKKRNIVWSMDDVMNWWTKPFLRSNKMRLWNNNNPVRKSNNIWQ